MTQTFPAPKTLSGLHLFYHPGSNCASRAYLTLAEKQLDFEAHKVNLLGGGQLSESFLAYNPKGEIPILIHDGKVICESIDIMLYLEQQFPQASLSPKDDAGIKLMNHFLDLARESHYTGVVEYVYAHGLGRLPTPKQRKFYDQHIPHRSEFHQQRLAGKRANNQEQTKANIDQAFSTINQQLQQHEFLAGNEFSLADIAWFANLHTLELLGYRCKQFTRVQQWNKTIKQRPAYSQYRKQLPPIPDKLLSCMAIIISKVVQQFGQRK